MADRKQTRAEIDARITTIRESQYMHAERRARPTSAVGSPRGSAGAGSATGANSETRLHYYPAEPAVAGGGGTEQLTPGPEPVAASTSADGWRTPGPGYQGQTHSHYFPDSFRLNLDTIAVADGAPE